MGKPGTESKSVLPRGHTQLAEAESGLELLSSRVFLLPNSYASSHKGKLRPWDLAQGCTETSGKGMAEASPGEEVMAVLCLGQGQNRKDRVEGSRQDLG